MHIFLFHHLKLFSKAFHLKVNTSSDLLYQQLSNLDKALCGLARHAPSREPIWRNNWYGFTHSLCVIKLYLWLHLKKVCCYLESCLGRSHSWSRQLTVNEASTAFDSLLWHSQKPKSFLQIRAILDPFSCTEKGFILI